MKTTIIYTHPETEGHCSCILANVREFLKENKIKANIIDLYKMKYDPVLAKNELYTSGNRDISKQNKKLQALIKESDNLIFIYPLWHGTMPAMLKGFFDRILTPHYAFKYVNQVPVGLLTGKKALVLMSTGGPNFLYKFLFRTPIAHIKFILKFVGIKTTVKAIGKCQNLTGEKRQLISQVTNKSLEKFFNQ